MSLYSLLLIGHIIGLALGAGGAFVTDFLFFRSLKDERISEDESNLIKASSTIVWVGIFILVVSGFTMLWLGDFAMLESSGFQAKLTLVAILIINGAIFHFYHLPFITDDLQAKKLSTEDYKHTLWLSLSGAVSVITWLGVIILGYLRDISLGYGEIILIYLAAIVVGGIAALIVRRFEFTAAKKAKGQSVDKGLQTQLLIGVVVILAVILSLSSSTFSSNSSQEINREASQFDFTPVEDMEVAADGERYVAYAPDVPPPIDRQESKIIEIELEVVENVCPVDKQSGTEFETWGYRIAGDDEVKCGVPGPVIRGRVGDVARITLVNPETSKHPHNIDFHAVTGGLGGAEGLSVDPGESATIEARLLYPGAFMYHCAMNDVPEHIAHGMYGQFIVDPREPLPEVDHEWSVSQSEWYLDRSATGTEVATLDREGMLDENPEFITFNGRTDALRGDNALQMSTGERARIYFVNQGLNLTSSFHPIGSHWDLVYPEGATHGSNQPIRGSQSTSVVVGGGSVVELAAQVPGDIILVDHALSRTFYKGALGIISVEGEENLEIYNPRQDSNVEAESAEDNGNYQSDAENTTGEVREFTLEAGNYYFSEDEIVVNKGDTVRITVENVGGFHDWTLSEFGVATDRLQTGQSTTIEFVADKVGEFPYFCSVGNHRQLGQEGVLIVEE